MMRLLAGLVATVFAFGALGATADAQAFKPKSKSAKAAPKKSAAPKKATAKKTTAKKSKAKAKAAEASDESADDEDTKKKTAPEDEDDYVLIEDDDV